MDLNEESRQDLGVLLYAMAMWMQQATHTLAAVQQRSVRQFVAEGRLLREQAEHAAKIDLDYPFPTPVRNPSP